MPSAHRLFRRRGRGRGRSSSPAYVFCDIGTPEVDRYGVPRSIRRLERGATTGWRDALTRRKTSEAGFDLHLVKPVSLTEVAAILARTA